MPVYTYTFVESYTDPLNIGNRGGRIIDTVLHSLSIQAMSRPRGASAGEVRAYDGADSDDDEAEEERMRNNMQVRLPHVCMGLSTPMCSLLAINWRARRACRCDCMHV